MEETKLFMFLLISAYIYTILWMTLFHLLSSSSYRPASLLRYLTSSSLTLSDEVVTLEEISTLRPISDDLYTAIFEKEVEVPNEYNFTRFFENYNYVPVIFYAKRCKWSLRLSRVAVNGSAVLMKMDFDSREKVGIGESPTIDLSAITANKSFNCSFEGIRNATVEWVKMKMIEKDEQSIKSV